MQGKSISGKRDSESEDPKVTESWPVHKTARRCHGHTGVKERSGKCIREVMGPYKALWGYFILTGMENRPGTFCWGVIRFNWLIKRSPWLLCCRGARQNRENIIEDIAVIQVKVDGALNKEQSWRCESGCILVIFESKNVWDFLKDWMWKRNKRSFLFVLFFYSKLFFLMFLFKKCYKTGKLASVKNGILQVGQILGGWSNGQLWVSPV